VEHEEHEKERQKMKRRMRDKVDVSLHVEFKTPNQRLAWELMESKDVVFLTGLAGTGKTFLAMAYAIQQVLSKKKEFIYITRPILESGEKLGFLPGDVAAKTAPYFQPLYSAMSKLNGGSEVIKVILSQCVKEVPLAYLRGMNFEDNIIAICDEAQNLTLPNFILYMTRMCKGSQIIFSGDEKQTDLRNSGLAWVSDQLSDLPEIGCIKFGRQDIQRSPLIQKILDRLETE
jgi:phosphate starvation-inducible PhoH-like protein